MKVKDLLKEEIDIEPVSNLGERCVCEPVRVASAEAVKQVDRLRRPFVVRILLGSPRVVVAQHHRKRYRTVQHL